MSTCGVGPIDSGLRPSSYALSPLDLIEGHAWPTRTLTFGFPEAGYVWTDPVYNSSGVNISSGFAPCPEHVRVGCRAAFAAIAAETTLQFTEVAGNLAQIQVGMNDLMTGTTVQGTASYPPNGSIFFRPDTATTHTWTLGQAGGHIAMHEIGHAVGLKHPPAGITYAETIMVPITPPSPWATDPRDADSSAMIAIYGGLADRPQMAIIQPFLAG